jgi:hypothetical protein
MKELPKTSATASALIAHPDAAQLTGKGFRTLIYVTVSSGTKPAKARMAQHAPSAKKARRSFWLQISN